MLNSIVKATQLISCGAKIPTLCDFKVHILSITLCWREVPRAWFKHHEMSPGKESPYLGENWSNVARRSPSPNREVTKVL